MHGRRIASVLGLLLFFHAFALAQERGFYVGGSLGGTDYRSSARRFDDPPDESSPGSIVAGTGFVDNTDRGWSLGVGYKLGRYFSLEGGWTDLGQVRFQGLTTGQGGLYQCAGGAADPCAVRVTSETDGLFVTGIGILPLGRFGLLGTLGFFSRKSDFRLRDDRPGEFSGSTTSTETVYGAGVEYRFDGGPTVRIRWEKYTDIVPIFNKADVDYYSAGLIYRFNRQRGG
jgi:OOP family OmpA-OmpF porin